MELVDRSLELDQLCGLLAQAAERTSAVVVVRGEPGIGKTALLDVVAARAADQGMRVIWLTGVESEVPLGYAALHRLLVPYPRLVEQLPVPQRDALHSTFGLVDGPPPDRFMVALGVLTLLADAASSAPLLCIIDDAQWLDPESAVVLGFVARRLQAVGIAMIFAVRELSQVAPALQGLPEVVIGALEASDAAALLEMIAPSPLSPHVAARLITEGGGNPLAMVELTTELTPAQLAGSAELPDPLLAAGSLQQMFRRRLGRLSSDAQLLLAVAAAEPAASETMLWRVATRLGVDADLAAAQVSGLLEFAPAVTFRHPLVRSVAYHSMPVGRRRLVHQTLAEVIDAGEQSDRVAWHLAMATTGPDEGVAARLVEAAGRATERGGYAATATFLARAAELSDNNEQRTERVLASAEAALAAGRLVQAQALTDQGLAQATSNRQLAKAQRLGGEVSLATGRIGDAARQLLAAAKLLPPVDRPGRATLLTALTAANFAPGDTLEEVRAFSLGVAEIPVDLEDPSAAGDCLLVGLLHRLSGAPRQAAPLLRAAVGHLCDPAMPDAVRMQIPQVAAVVAAVELLHDSTYEVLEVYVRSARRSGALMVLSAALTGLAGTLLTQGRFEDCEQAWAEARALGEATGAPGLPDPSFVELGLACWRGHEDEARHVAARITARVQRRLDDGRETYHPPWYHLAVLDLSLGRYRQAYDHVLPDFREDRLAVGIIVLPDLIEAAVRCNEMPVAQQALDRLEERAQASGALWGRGCLARCEALLAGDAGEALYRQAIDLLEQSEYLTDLARAHLLYGEWLRRERRRRDARVQLGVAYDMFTQMGADGFVSRASGELAATGERARKRTVETTQTLTPQEAQVARLVAQGGTNRDVAAELFLSPATIEYHLRKVYQKLGVTSRTQLARSMLTTNG